METAVPLFLTFLLIMSVCFVHASVIIWVGFDATVMQVRGLASYKTRFNPRFSTQENACTKSGI